MNDTDTKLASEGIKIAGTVALSLVNPILAVPWELGFSLYGAVAERRKNKAEEWLSLFTKNKSVFSDEIVKTGSFQDGFINSFENYLRERNAEKRRIMSAVFLGFTQSDELDEFPLERCYSVLGSISPPALRKLAEIANMPEVHGEVFFQVNLSNDAEVEQSVTSDHEAIHELVALNILLSDPAARLGPLYEPFVMLGNFGKLFIRFVADQS